MTKKDKLLNEQTIRRWAKLADLSVINENFFEEEETETTDTETTNTEDTVTEEEATDEETVVAEEEGEEEGDMEVDMEAGEADDAEGMDVVQAVLAALEPFGVEVDEDDAGEEAGEEMEMDAAPEAGEDPAMDHGMKDPAMDHGMGDYGNRQDETLDLEVVDDEALTEAVLKRVLKRILSNK